MMHLASRVARLSGAAASAVVRSRPAAAMTTSVSSVATNPAATHADAIFAAGAEPTALRPQPTTRRTFASSSSAAAATSTSPLVYESPDSLVALMKAHGLTRGYVVTDPATLEVTCSHPQLQPLADFLAADKVDFDNHEAVFFELGQETGALMGAFLWNTRRGQGCGGIRLKPYTSTEAWLRDGIRLAVGMGRKSALAGLWWGGGKGVIARPPGEDYLMRPFRDALFRDYGAFLSSLRGCYVAAEDAGVTSEDCDVVFSKSRYTTCISPRLGGSGNPSVPTAAGVVAAMEGALDFAGMGTLEGKSVSVQGVGNVGLPLIEFLLDKGVSRIVATESQHDRFHIAKAIITPDARLDMRLVDDSDLSALHEDVDIVAPCAFGGVLNPSSIPGIRAKIICGAANNQLVDPTDDAALAERGILYTPDFVANRMGIVNCANEQYGSVGRQGAMEDPAITRHLGRDDANAVFNVVKRVFERAQATGVTPATAANELADEAAAVPHPIWGHRSADIIQSLVADGWSVNTGPERV